MLFLVILPAHNTTSCSCPLPLRPVSLGVDSCELRDSIDFVDAQTEDLGDDPPFPMAVDSKSSSPSSEAEFNSCTNSPKLKIRGTEDSLGSGEAAPGSLSMSANVADKLSRLRLTRDSPEEDSEPSYENPNWEDIRDMPAHDSDDSMGPSRRPAPKSSLRQVFPYVSCLPFENNMVFCFVLSVWDNIVGPQTVYVWKRKAFPSQKTFEVLHDPADVEVGEENMHGHPSISQREIYAASPTVSKSWGSQDMEMWENSRRPSTASSTFGTGRYSSQEPEQCYSPKPPENFGANSKSIPFSKPMNKEKNGVGSIESFCEDMGNSILMESLSAAKTDRGMLSAAKTDEGMHYNEEPSQSASESETIGDLPTTGPSPETQTSPSRNPDAGRETREQEGGGRGWWCGKGRLRVGSVAWYVTEHSVGVGQVGPASDKITSVLHVVPHQGIIILAARFTVEESEGATPYCLSMVVPVEEYTTFLPLTHTVTTWLLTTAATARLLLTKHGLEGGGYIKEKLVELCGVLVALRSASLDQYPLTPAPRPPDDRRFAEVALTSHLQTLGASVVVADSPNAANKMIMWLAQFSDPNTLHASRLCLSFNQWPFHPGLYIQGIMRSANGEVNLSAHKLLQSPHPVTVVDVGRGMVKQTGTPDVHARRSASALSQELLSLWHDLPDVSVPSESLLEPVRGAAPLVKKFLHDYDRLGSCDNEVRQGFITAFLRSLHYTALAVITWTKHQWCVERRKSGYGSLRRALCSVFEVDDRDLRVILAHTERLEPGFYTYVASMSQ